MSRELKILLIVLGSLFGIALIGVVALVLALPHFLHSMGSGALDPASARRTAAKIATFDMPRGYGIESASDLGISQIVSIMPNRGRARGTFRIQLQGTLAASSASTDASVAGMKIGLGLFGKLVPCDLKDAGTDDVRVRGVLVKLAVLRCANAQFPFRIETGTFPGNAPQATVTALGSGTDFDTGALHALLTSVR